MEGQLMQPRGGLKYGQQGERAGKAALPFDSIQSTGSMHSVSSLQQSMACWQLWLCGAAPASKAAQPQQQQGWVTCPQDADGAVLNGLWQSRQCGEVPCR